MSKYRVKVIKRPGVMCVSIVDNKKHYVDDFCNVEDPKGQISKEYRDPKVKRYRIINKLKSKYNNEENSMAIAINE